jgi:hypothetical protein
LVAVLVWAGVCKSVCGVPDISTKSPPNVVVILADDQRACDLGIAGHPVLKTPHVDALARRGVYFTKAFVTTAACIEAGCHQAAG